MIFILKETSKKFDQVKVFCELKQEGFAKKDLLTASYVLSGLY